MLVLVSAYGEVKNIIKEADYRFCIGSGDTLGLVEIIKKFMRLGENEREQLSLNVLAYYKENFDKKNLMDRMEAYV